MMMGKRAALPARLVKVTSLIQGRGVSVDISDFRARRVKVFFSSIHLLQILPAVRFNVRYTQ